MNNSMYFEVKDGKKTNDQNFSMRIPDKDMDQSQQNHSAHNDAYRSKLLSRAEQQEYNDFQSDAVINEQQNQRPYTRYRSGNHDDAKKQLELVHQN